MKTRILVLGGTGLLGSAVTKYFLNDDEFEINTTCRDKSISIDENALLFDALVDSLEILPTNYDYVLNCIGVIKPFMKQDPAAAIKINALFPWQIAQWCNDNGMKLIHITSDCVFSGKRGKYKEDDEHDALDAYGKSKSLGEPITDAMVIRTSIIGEELHKNASLIEWAKSQKGKAVDGYVTHLWNGVTTKQYAAICAKIIKNSWYEKGLFHVTAKDDVSKYQMLRHFDEKFKLDLDIRETTPESIDRTLRTTKQLCEKLEVPTVRQMVMDL
ncbi:MAG: sugar nucleotide-binding protein [Oscillospiraceae bacterium]|nr:sugar nucleotide-binding protein [Oscillospiraceae bacterium]